MGGRGTYGKNFARKARTGTRLNIGNWDLTKTGLNTWRASLSGRSQGNLRNTDVERIIKNRKR